MWSFIAALFSAFFKSAFDAFNQYFARVNSDKAHERAGAAEAAAETKDVISEIADARSKLDAPPSDADGLAADFRKRIGS